MSVFFTLGQPFTLGVFGSAASQNASSWGVKLINQASVDFSHTVLWHGIGSVTLNGGAIDYTISSASVIDCSGAVTSVPEPASAALWAMGLCVLAAVAGRRHLPAASGIGRTS